MKFNTIDAARESSPKVRDVMHTPQSENLNAKVMKTARAECNNARKCTINLHIKFD